MQAIVQCKSALQQEPAVLDDALQILVYDDFDQLIVIIRKQQNGTITLLKASDPGFSEAAAVLGVQITAKHEVLGVN